MKIQIEQLLSDTFEYDVPQLIVSEEEIRMAVPPGSNGQGILYVGTQEDVIIQGFAVSTHRRFVVGAGYFSGTAVQIPYGFDGSGLSPGDACQGELLLLTNLGEYRIPFSLRVEGSLAQSSVGRIRGMDDFVELARSNFREAFRLFNSPSFLDVVALREETARTLYRGMSEAPVTYQHLEEFLVGMGVKDPVRVQLGGEQAEYYRVSETVQEALLVKKSGWGYLQLEVEVVGDFIQVDKQAILDEDFIGSSFYLEYRIEADNLGKGRKYGLIRVKDAYGALDYAITASKSAKCPGNLSLYEKRQKLLLYKGYLEFRLHRLDYKSWASESLGILGQMEEAGCGYPMYQVYKAYVYYMDDQVEEARKILLEYQDRNFTRDDLELAGIYLYVCHLAGLLKDRGKVAQKLRALYRQKSNSFMLFWLLDQLDDELLLSTSKSLYLLEEQFNYGCRSPLLYLEAFSLVEKEISLLPHLDSFWIQVLLFAAENGMVGEEMADRVAYLSGYRKSFEPCLYRILACLYEKYPTQDILGAICRQIMNGCPRDRKFFPWLAKAVEENLRVTSLFEYYMDMLDADYRQLLPKSLRIYFLYNNTLGDDKKALVYANVIRHKKEDPQSYGSYRKIIEKFSKRKLREGAMDENYAALYYDCMDVMEEGDLQKIVFTHRVYCDRPDIRFVIVCHGQLEGEMAYPCVDGLAYPQIYSRDARILFQDERKRRFAATVDYNLRQLFGREMLELCSGQGAGQPGFLLNQCVSQGGLEKADVGLLLQIAQSEAFTQEYRGAARKALMNHYQSLGDGRVGDFLSSLDMEEYVKADKAQLAQLLIRNRDYEKAYQIYCTWGLEGVQLDDRVALCSQLIRERGFEEDGELEALAADCFHNGGYDESILQYLMAHYVGPVPDLYYLWKCAGSLQMDTYQLEEKLLAMSVFERDYFWDGGEVLEHYACQEGKEDVIKAYLALWSYGYFVRKKPMPDYVAQCLELAYGKGWDLGLVCRLALFSYLCEKRRLEESQLVQLKELLDECYRRNLTFAFFRKLPRNLLSAYHLEDKVFVEYVTAPRANVFIHYALDTGVGDGREYTQEPLPDLFQGIHGRTFTLFYGESIHYYFTIEMDGKVKRTSEKTLTKSLSHQGEGTKYQLLNEILAAKKLGKVEAVREKMAQYLEQERFVERMFPIEKGPVYE